MKPSTLSSASTAATESSRSRMVERAASSTRSLTPAASLWPMGVDRSIWISRCRPLCCSSTTARQQKKKAEMELAQKLLLKKEWICQNDDEHTPHGIYPPTHTLAFFTP